MSNKEVGTLESLVKSDSSVEQRVYFVRGLQRRSRASIKGRKAVRGLYGVLCSRRGLLRIVRKGVPYRLIKGLIMGL